MLHDANQKCTMERKGCESQPNPDCPRQMVHAFVWRSWGEVLLQSPMETMYAMGKDPSTPPYLNCLWSIRNESCPIKETDGKTVGVSTCQIMIGQATSLELTTIRSRPGMVAWPKGDCENILSRVAQTCRSHLLQGSTTRTNFAFLRLTGTDSTQTGKFYRDSSAQGFWLVDLGRSLDMSLTKNDQECRDCLGLNVRNCCAINLISHFCSSPKPMTLEQV